MTTPQFALKCIDPGDSFNNYYFKEIWGQNNKVLTLFPKRANWMSWDEAQTIQHQLNLEKGYHWLMIVSNFQC